MGKARKVAERGGGNLVRKILGGLWVRATWVPGTPGCVVGCIEAVKIVYRGLMGVGLGNGDTCNEWMVQLQEWSDAAPTTGGMINIDPLNSPLPPTLKD